MAAASKPLPALTEKNKRNFLRKISPTPTATGCLEWTAYRDTKGYGIINIGGKTVRAHRVAFFVSTGTDPGELHTLHTCDNTGCVNFEHLWLGSNMDNVMDKVRKGRAAKGDTSGPRLHPECLARGDESPSSKLTSEQIQLIRADTRTQRTIAFDYGVNHTTIGDVKRGSTWKHIA